MLRSGSVSLAAREHYSSADVSRHAGSSSSLYRRPRPGRHSLRRPRCSRRALPGTPPSGKPSLVWKRQERGRIEWITVWACASSNDSHEVQLRKDVCLLACLLAIIHTLPLQSRSCVRAPLRQTIEERIRAPSLVRSPPWMQAELVANVRDKRRPSFLPPPSASASPVPGRHTAISLDAHGGAWEL